jgi:hypothetical protein
MIAGPVDCDSCGDTNHSGENAAIDEQRFPGGVGVSVRGKKRPRHCRERPAHLSLECNAVRDVLGSFRVLGKDFFLLVCNHRQNKTEIRLSKLKSELLQQSVNPDFCAPPYLTCTIFVRMGESRRDGGASPDFAVTLTLGTQKSPSVATITVVLTATNNPGLPKWLSLGNRQGS